jgi:hypothetical protein
MRRGIDRRDDLLLGALADRKSDAGAEISNMSAAPALNASCDAAPPR